MTADVGSLLRRAAGRGALVLLGLGAGLAVAFVGAEVYFRLTSAPFHPEALRARSLEYRDANTARHVLPRNARSVRRGNLSQRISERGYRGDGFEIEKPEGVTRLAVVGGSAVFDIHAGRERDWPTRAGEALRDAGRRVEVLNLGIPGHASWDGLGRLYGEAWMFEPDWVALYNCWNDLKYFGWIGPDSTLLRTPVSGSRAVGRNPYLGPVNRLDRWLLASRAYAWLRWYYLGWRLPAAPEGVRREPGRLADEFSRWGPEQYELTVRLFVEAARESGARPLLVTQARLPVQGNERAVGDRIRSEYVGLSHAALVRAFRACDEALRRVSREENVPLLDLSSLNGRDALFVDQVHLTAAGRDSLTARFSSFLDGVLPAR